MKSQTLSMLMSGAFAVAALAGCASQDESPETYEKSESASGGPATAGEGAFDESETEEHAEAPLSGRIGVDYEGESATEDKNDI